MRGGTLEYNHEAIVSKCLVMFAISITSYKRSGSIDEAGALKTEDFEDGLVVLVMGRSWSRFRICVTCFYVHFYDRIQ